MENVCNMKNIGILLILLATIACSAQKTAIPLERQRSIVNFCDYLNNGKFGLDANLLAKIFYIESIEKGAQMDSASYQYFLHSVQEFRKKFGHINSKEIKIVSLIDSNDPLIKKLDSSLKVDAYKLKYNHHSIYLYFKENRIRSFKIVSFGGEPRFWGIE